MKASRCGWCWLVLALGIVCPELKAQGYVLQSGSVLVLRFTSLPLVSSNPSLHPALFLDLQFVALPTDSFRVELFEDNISGQPFDDYVAAGVPGVTKNDLQTVINEPQHPWRDLQGAIRFTGITGSAGLTSLTIQVYDPPNLYGGMLPVPEPATGVLLATGLGLLGLRLTRSGRRSQAASTSVFRRPSDQDQRLESGRGTHNRHSCGKPFKSRWW